MASDSIQQLEHSVAQLQSRNQRVEGDKAWETSRVRIGTIAMITYVTALVLMMTLEVAYPGMSALIPMAGFIFSTLSLPPLKKWWLQRFRKNKRFQNARHLHFKK